MRAKRLIRDRGEDSASPRRTEQRDAMRNEAEASRKPKARAAGDSRWQ